MIWLDIITDTMDVSLSKLRGLLMGVSQVALVVKNPPANVGDVRDVGSIPGSGRSLEEEMATHSSILAWRTLWKEGGAWWAAVCGVAMLKSCSLLSASPQVCVPGTGLGCARLCRTTLLPARIKELQQAPATTLCKIPQNVSGGQSGSAP